MFGVVCSWGEQLRLQWQYRCTNSAKIRTLETCRLTDGVNALPVVLLNLPNGLEDGDRGGDLIGADRRTEVAAAAPWSLFSDSNSDRTTN